MVDNLLLTPAFPVSTLLSTWPQVIPVFIAHRMNCVGCDFSSFDTLEDVATNYGLATSEFLNELLQVIQKDSPPHASD